jgi:glycosyltransferase involved in cell wall biosynthesis
MGEQRVGEVERRLLLNGVYEHPPVTRFGELKALEIHNHRVLGEAIASFEPDLIHCYSLHGLSKSLVFALRNSRIPTVYDVADYWIAKEIQTDPWLSFWNRPRGPLGPMLRRTALELTGARHRVDPLAPTRLMRGYDRIPELWGKTDGTANSISAFRFDRLYFSSQALKDATAEAGFRVNHAEVIYFCIDTQQYFGDLKPASAPFKKYLIVSQLDSQSGVLTAVQALKMRLDRGGTATLSIYGRGDSNYIAEIRSYIATNELTVEFLPVSNLARELPPVYRRHDALIYPAEWNEPFSTVPLEAMACGLPVIASAAGGVAELMRHGENALTYPAGDAAALADQMELIEQDPKKRGALADTGQQEVLSKFNQSATIDKIENYLQTSLEVWAHTAS